ncbi:MAG: hypothetical protein JW909_12915 [Planctomycetes bacterium]|nr:hypothetical protein [Planctomycetota bacterium]
MITLSQKDRRNYLDAALKAADWFVNSQRNTGLHRFDADRGRFLYYYYMPEKKFVPGINWTMGRALFVLSDAYRVTGDTRYLASAELGARYVAALQEMDPAAGRLVGVIREYVPQMGYCGVLDGAQACSGLLMLEQASGNPEYLRRGRAWCDCLLGLLDDTVGMPHVINLDKDLDVEYSAFDDYTCISQCSAIPFWHLYRRTGEAKYVKPVMRAADAILRYQRPDGAFNYTLKTDAGQEVTPNHHWGRGKGDERFILRNDDGIMVVVLAAYQHTNDARYLDSAVAYADWTINNEPHERPFSGFPIQANNVLDTGAVSGKDYSPWVIDNLQKHLLDLQVSGTGDPAADGGFRGEDEEDEGGIFGGISLDYVPTRVTCYAAGTLFRLSGKGTGTGFSPFGMGT